jgi:O-acetyl-ADP-ribose deacetylase (regulator of RNase III)
MIKHIKGDLLKLLENDFFDVIAHGANCYNIMGAGIAKQIAEKYPEVLLVDKDLNVEPLLKLGRSSYAIINDKVIFNLYTQLEPGANFNVGAYRSALKDMASNVYPFDYNVKIGLPYIGCGIGGFNDKKIIEKIAEEELDDYTVYFVEYEPS